MITFTDTKSGSMIVRRNGLCVGILTFSDGEYDGAILNTRGEYEEVVTSNRTLARAAAISIASD